MSHALFFVGAQSNVRNDNLESVNHTAKFDCEVEMCYFAADFDRERT